MRLLKLIPPSTCCAAESAIHVKESDDGNIVAWRRDCGCPVQVVEGSATGDFFNVHVALSPRARFIERLAELLCREVATSVRDLDQLRTRRVSPSAEPVELVAALSEFDADAWELLSDVVGAGIRRVRVQLKSEAPDYV